VWGRVQKVSPPRTSPPATVPRPRQDDPEGDPGEALCQHRGAATVRPGPIEALHPSPSPQRPRAVPAPTRAGSDSGRSGRAASPGPRASRSAGDPDRDRRGECPGVGRIRLGRSPRPTSRPIPPRCRPVLRWLETAGRSAEAGRQAMGVLDATKTPRGRSGGPGARRGRRALVSPGGAWLSLTEAARADRRRRSARRRGPRRLYRSSPRVPQPGRWARRRARLRRRLAGVASARADTGSQATIVRPEHPTSSRPAGQANRGATGPLPLGGRDGGPVGCCVGVRWPSAGFSRPGWRRGRRGPPRGGSGPGRRGRSRRGPRGGSGPRPPGGA